MALPLWDQLQKSQDDPETIEQAIERLISEHNDNPESHLGEGQSLEEHKTENVIDHPQGSVLADKDTMTEIAVRTVFESLDAWSKTGTVSPADVLGLRLYVEWGSVNNSSLHGSPQVPINFRDSSKMMVFQVLARFDLSNNNYNSAFGFFGSNEVTPQGFGFVKDGSNFYGHARQGSNQNRTSAITVDLTQDHIYRATLDPYNGVIEFFIDGLPVGEVFIPGIGWEDDTGPRLWLGATASNDGNMYVGELYFSREV
jgi:hypothetical protein